jgi:hypothetical protein
VNEQLNYNLKTYNDDSMLQAILLSCKTIRYSFYKTFKHFPFNYPIFEGNKNIKLNQFKNIQKQTPLLVIEKIIAYILNQLKNLYHFYE